MLAFVMVTDRRFCNAYFNTTPLLTCLQLLWSHPLLWGSEAIPLDSDGPSALRKVALKMIQHHLKIQHTVLGVFFAVVELMYLFLGPTLKKKKKIRSMLIFICTTCTIFYDYLKIFESFLPLKLAWNQGANIPWIAIVGFQNMSEFFSTCVLSLLTAMILLRLLRVLP